MKLYKIELLDDEFELYYARNDTEVVKYLSGTYTHCFGLDELDDDYEVIRSVDWRKVLRRIYPRGIAA